ncbi:HNH endonuclease [Arcobacter ellisii]|uniref:HNH endonuclease n=1 Tax=Arcobacter ellisii TaxID=913109 RepID=A0A347UBW1_9BACT|nr:HNH endonuclease signature motif containing protein [Arcobacter ellisii]AXX96339.1 HNH endonuclease [Arcobacter ellisii]RXI31821.1 HNH endonuclease [Arcobacter ellisii]
MIPFRKKKPLRRDNVPIVSTYKQHISFLMEDFNNKCGYCDDSYTWRTMWYEIDHFIPQKKFPHRDPTEYKNLVFACRSCNNSKRAKWPTLNESLSHDGIQGFIDPCDEEYDKQFERKKDGSIKFKTNLGKWMFHNLKLHRPQHQIIWLIEQLDQNISELESLSVSISDEQVRAKIQDNLNKLLLSYRKYTKRLGEI